MFQTLKNLYIELKESYQNNLDTSEINDSFGFFFAGYIQAKKNFDTDQILKMTEKIQLSIKQDIENENLSKQLQNETQIQNTEQIQENNKKSLKQMFSALASHQTQNEQEDDLLSSRLSNQPTRNSNSNNSSINNNSLQNNNNLQKNNSIILGAQQTPPSRLKNSVKKAEKLIQNTNSIGNLNDISDNELQLSISKKNSNNQFLNKIFSKKESDEIQQKQKKSDDKNKFTSDEEDEQIIPQKKIKPSLNKGKKFIRISQQVYSSQSRSRSRSQSPPKNNRQRLKYKGQNELTVDHISQQNSNSRSQSRKPSASPEIDTFNNNFRQKAEQRKQQLKLKLLQEQQLINENENIQDQKILEKQFNSDEEIDVENNSQTIQKKFKNQQLTINFSQNTQKLSQNEDNDSIEIEPIKKYQQQIQKNPVNKFQAKLDEKKTNNNKNINQMKPINIDSMSEDEDEKNDINNNQIIQQQNNQIQKQQSQKIKQNKLQNIIQQNNIDSDLNSDSEENQLQKPQQKQIQKQKNIKKQDSFEEALLQIKQFEEQEKLNQQQIQLLQKQEEEEFQKQQKQKNAQEEEDNICSVCYGNLMEEQTQPIPLQNCEHIFHQSCFLDYIKSEIDTRKIEFQCPQDDCDKNILENDFRDIIDKKYYDKYLGYSIATYVDKNSEKAAWCPTAGCDYVFLLEEDDKNKNNFECPQCKKHYCLNCKVEFNKGHKGMTCKEFQVSNKRDKNDIAFEKFVQKKKFKQCPHCSYWVSKSEGCYNMTCKCGHTFCYVCGGPTVNYYCAGCSGKKKGAVAAPAPLIKPIKKAKKPVAKKKTQKR